MAQAQCTPDPTQVNTSVNCTGTDTNGLVVTTTSSPVTVQAIASVTNSGAPAITVSIPAAVGIYQRSASIMVNGTVAATGDAGISVMSGALGTAAYDYSGTAATIQVGTAGSISGTHGITVAQSSGNPYASATVWLTNAGTISGTSGVALYTADSYSSFSQIMNQPTGIIGAIQGMVNGLYNLGTINGGTLSALASGNATYGAVTNSGTITSAASGGTIVNYGSSITNSGTISNTGAGPALSAPYLNVSNQTGGTISASGASVLTAGTTSTTTLTNAGTIINTGTGNAVTGGWLYVTNNAGGLIAAGTGGTALAATQGLTLVNTGTIQGNVAAGSAGVNYDDSSVDSTGGTITGNVTFGAGNDTLIATLRNGSLYTGISGTIDGGAGSNTLQVRTTSDTTLSAPLTLPTNFTLLSLAPASGTTLTLANGFTNAGSLYFDGYGTLDNQTTLSGTSQIIGPSTYLGYGTLKNSGTITSANAGGATAITLTGYTALNNTGIITANGNAVSMSIGGFTNSGTITAGGTGVSAFIGVGTFNNSGSITSTGGTGVNLSFSCTCFTGTNSGTISGAAVGLSLGSGILVNTGSITSANTAVQLSAYATLDNRAGGVVSGTGTAISANGAPFYAKVINAGTINGNVNLTNGLSYSIGIGNTYYAATGGVLNGNLTLGIGDTLITDLANTGTGAYAGINGTVTANNSNLIYNVNANGSATTAAAGFSSLTFQLANNAALALTGSGALSAPLALAGTGSVTLTGTISATNNAIQTQSVQTSIGYGYTASALVLTNNGSISVTHNNSYYFSPSAVALGAGDQLVNNGTIALTNTAPPIFYSPIFTPSYTAAAVSGTRSVTNTGTITGSGAAGVVLGSAATGAVSLVNSGQIASDQTTVVLTDVGTITNSGRINSTGTAAIGTASTYPFYSFTPFGPITLNNSGTIAGNIALYGVDAAINDSGGIAGNITTGAGNDSVVITGAYAGNIDLGSGTNTLAIASGTQAVPVALGTVANVSSFTQSAGFTTIGTSGSFGTLTMSGGRLVGLAGSTITAPSILVGSGATFGSAGTVNGNVVVNGVLSPGASPGTMTVNGNVSLNTGSTALFELTPTVSDKLIVNGRLTIQPGSTLQIASTGVVPGTTLTLVAASGGISGGFDTLSGAAGLLKSQNGQISLRLLFSNPIGVSPQVQRSVDYVNAALSGDTVSPTLLAAMPSLMTATGGASPQAFARLTPEPYASATQIGVENAITLASAARAIAGPDASSPHAFAFGQALGDWRGFQPRTQGVSDSSLDGFGFIGGLGYAGHGWSIAGFGGYLNQSQSIGDLAASTRSRGFAGGVTGRVVRAGSELAISVIRDTAQATTRRLLPGDIGSTGGFALHSWTVDAQLATSLTLDAQWELRPHVGATWVRTHRGATQEASASVLALSVAADDHTAAFVDGGVRFQSAAAAPGHLRRFLDLGLRYQVQGQATGALGGFAGGPVSLYADGVRRAPVSVTASAGLDYRLTSAVSFQLTGNGEAASGTHRASVTGGMTVRF